MIDKHWIYTIAKSGIHNFQRLRKTWKKSLQKSLNNFKDSLIRRESKCRRRYWGMWKG